MSETIQIGGPTVWIQAPSGLWGEFRLPEGKRVENGDSFTIWECEFIGPLHRQISYPKRPKDPTPEQLQAWETALEEWNSMLESNKLRVTFSVGGGLLPEIVNLWPLNENGE